MNLIRAIALFTTQFPSDWTTSLSFLPFPMDIILETVPGGSERSDLAHTLRDPSLPSNTKLRANHGKRPLPDTFETGRGLRFFGGKQR